MKRNIAIILLVSIFLVIVGALIINHNHQIQFKKVTTCDSNIKVTGNVALDAKKNMFISDKFYSRKKNKTGFKGKN